MNLADILRVTANWTCPVKSAAEEVYSPVFGLSPPCGCFFTLHLHVILCLVRLTAGPALNKAAVGAHIPKLVYWEISSQQHMSTIHS
jgi:hypothetical protein